MTVGPCECIPFVGPCVCGITDTFTRVSTSPDPGPPDCGLTYSGALVGTTTFQATGFKGLITLSCPSIGSDARVTATLTPPPTLWDIAAVHSIQIAFDNFGDPALAAAEKIEFGLLGARIVIFPSNASLWLQGAGGTPSASAYSQITWNADVVSGTQIPLSYWVPGTVYTFSVYTSGSTRVAAISNGATTYTIAIGSVPTFLTTPTYYAFRELISPFSTAVITSITLDNYDLPEVTRCSMFVFDDFHRVVASAWDGPWDNFGFFAADASVNNTYGQMSVATGVTDTMHTLGGGGWQTATGFTGYHHFEVSDVPSTGEFLFFELRDDDFLLDVFLTISDDPTWGSIYLESATSDFVVKTDWLALTEYVVKFEYIPNVSAKVKVWEFGAAEPGSWDVEVGANDVLTTEWRVSHANGSGISPVEFRSFLVDFDYEGEPCYSGGPVAGGDTTPSVNQPVQNDPIGYGNGIDLAFFTSYPYIANSLMVFSSGILERVNNIDPATGHFSFITAPPIGAVITADYRAIG